MRVGSLQNIYIRSNGFVIMTIWQVNTIQNEPGNAFPAPPGHEFVTLLYQLSLV